MSLPAFRNDYGSHIRNKPYLEVREEYRDGALWATTFHERECTTDRVDRWGHTSNPVKDLGSGVMWRDPAGYGRSVTTCEYTRGKFQYPANPPFGNYTIYETIPSNDGWSWTEIEPLMSLWDVNFDDSQRNRARFNAMRKLSGSKAQMANNILEARRTYRSLLTRTEQLLRALLAIKNGRWGQLPKIFGIRNLREASRSLADIYLEWKFGWKPLASDIYATLEVFKDLMEPPMLVSGYGQSHDATRVDETSGPNRKFGSASRIHACKCYGRLTDAYLHAAQQTGLLNPLSIGWEAIPFSFVVDWVTPIGGLIEALNAPSGLDFVGGYESVRAEGSLDYLLSHGSDYKRFSYATKHVNRFSFIRQRLYDWPEVKPVVNSPFRSSLALTALALFRQLWK